MSFLSDLLFAILGNQVINDLEHRHDRGLQDGTNTPPADSGRAFVEDDDDFLGLL